MSRTRYSQAKMLKRNIKNIIYQIFNPTLTHLPQEGLNSLKRKLFLYFFLNPKQKIKFKNEVDFLKKKAKKNFIYSFIFPYPFIFDLDYKMISTYFDNKHKLNYVIHQNKRLYFRAKHKTKEEVQIAYYCAFIEQNTNSPHCYLTNDFTVNTGDILFDIGAAEGILGLEVIDKVKELYLFESNSDWIPALKATFEPWKDKVHIYNKFVSDNNDGENITLDSLQMEDKVDFIKLDVEGAEIKILEGAQKLIQTTGKIAICCYHRHNDEVIISKYLKNKAFKTSFSDGYMLFLQRKIVPPYFCKGLIRAENSR
jgi:hypothetical protein